MLRSLVTAYLNLKSDKNAVTAIEYALIAALIAIAIITAVTMLGGNAAKTFSHVANEL